ncbi:MAG TPA: hypothetical protein VF587_07440 [Solirubrobacteraceae bacterium]
MSAEQIVVLILIVAAFVAGWVARGGGDGEEEAAEEAGAAPPLASAAISPAAPALAPTTVAPASGDARKGRRGRAAPRADPVADAARALTLAAAAYEKAVDRWLDERDEITPAGRAAVGEVERAAQRLDTATARLDETDHPLADAAWDALDALRDAVRHLDAFRAGHALDGTTSTALDRIEDELERARAAFEGGAA